MLFNVDNDSGDRITGYLVPDSIVASGRVRVSAGERPIAHVEATETIASLIAAGRHETGRCGFAIDETVVPDLRHLDQLEIRDAETGILIYRRAPSHWFIAGKLIRLETHLVPLRRIDRAVARQFSYVYCKADRLSAESMAQIFHLLPPTSLYLSARFLYKTFEANIEKQFKLICMIHEPFEELAERLLLFRRAARRGYPDVRDTLFFKPAIDFAAGLALDGDQQLRRSFSRIPLEAAMALNNPLVRQLTVFNPQDLPRTGALGAALDVLASCAVVGLRTEAEQFSLTLSALLAAPRNIVPVAPRCVAAMALAERLRRIPAAYDLLELDIELYARAARAFQNAGAGLTLAS